jgi:DNA-directed RNA polymerase subunit H (RpoH/RPB5)
VSPQNNDFEYPLAVAEKRAADRAILKALGIHGNVYSAEELPNIKNNNNENNNISTDQGDIILEKIKTITHQGNLEELKSKNKKFLNELKKKNLLRFQELKQAFLNREQQLTEG